MDVFIEYLRLFTVSQLIFFLVAGGWSRNPLAVRFSLVALAIGIIAYMFLPMLYSELREPLRLVMWMLPEFVPLCLGVLVWLVFEDDEPIPLWMICLMLLQVVISFWAYIDHNGEGAIYALDIARHLIKVVMVCMVMVILLRGRATDLVVERLALRQFICTVIALCSLSVLFFELYYSFKVPKLIELAGLLVFFGSSLAVNVIVLRTNPEFRLIPEKVTRAPVPLSSDSLDRDSDVRRIIDLMQSQRAYARHNYKIADFATDLSIPEHQLRKKINQELGFRNFNQFINSFRLQEAAERLVSEPRLPILTIALDVGFASISVFNTSFQKQFGTTPSEYRKSH